MALDLLTGTLPIAATGASACLVLVACALWRNPRAIGLASLALAALCLGAVGHLWRAGGRVSPGALLSSDPLALYLDGLFLVAGILVILLSMDYFRAKGSSVGEVYGLILLSITGMMTLVSATHLLTFYLGLETMSISFYTLAGTLRRHENAIESSLKYFLLGSFSSAFLLFGMALLYASSGRLDYTGLSNALYTGIYQSLFGEGVLLLGFFLLLVGLFFKLSLIPFHFWAPDVYQGAPTPISALMAVGGKAAAAGAAIRIFLTVFAKSPLLSGKWFTLFVGIGIITIFIGSMIALTQRHTKRLLAYSSIVHAGFLSLGIGALSLGDKSLVQAVLEALLFYLGAYLLMNVGAFACASVTESPDSTDETVRSLSGLGGASPALAAALSVLLFSLAGIPLTAGFLGKLYLFRALVSGHLIGVAVAGLLGAVLATYYYLKVVVALYFPPPGADIAPAPEVPALTAATIALCAAGSLALGLFPGPVTAILEGISLG